MRALFTLTSAESRRLIAKGVAAMPQVRKAWESAYVLLAGGTTNGFVAQELTGDMTIDPALTTVGTSTSGLLCVSNPDKRRMFANVYYKGEAKPEMTLKDGLNDFHPETVVIKGANAFDKEGFVGVITSGFDGGTVPVIIGTVTSKGLTMITPVGIEKLVPNVRAASRALGGATHIDISMGADPGMYILGNTIIFTEIEAIKTLFDCEANLVCCGGVGGNEGAVTLVADGEEEKVRALVDFLENEVKGEPPVHANKGNCETCRYGFCRYCGKKPEELPAWMRKRGIED